MKKVKLTDLFDIVGARQIDKIKLQVGELNDVDALPYVTRTAKNNGVSGYCFPKTGMVNHGGLITLALDGSTGSTFYQHHQFLSGQNIWLLRPIEAKVAEFTPIIALYLVASIRKAVVAYTYNLSLTKTRLKNVTLCLPVDDDGSLDCVAIRKAMSKIRHVELVADVPDSRYQILD